MLNITILYLFSVFIYFKYNIFLEFAIIFLSHIYIKKKGKFMQKIWKKLSKLDKISFYVFITMLIVMILGLILIGTVSWTVKPLGAKVAESHDGFWILRNSHPWTIGDFIKGSITNFGVTMSLTDYFDKLKIVVAALGGTATLTGTAAQLQIGLILSVIATPILLFTSIIIFGYSCYLKVVKK